MMFIEEAEWCFSSRPTRGAQEWKARYINCLAILTVITITKQLVYSEKALFLTKMGDLMHSSHNVLICAATNIPTALDDAFLRRFSRRECIYFVLCKIYIYCYIDVHLPDMACIISLVEQELEKAKAQFKSVSSAEHFDVAELASLMSKRVRVIVSLMK